MHKISKRWQHYVTFILNKLYLEQVFIPFLRIFMIDKYIYLKKKKKTQKTIANDVFTIIIYIKILFLQHNFI